MYWLILAIEKYNMLFIYTQTFHCCTGVGLAMEKKDWPWSKKNRVIVSGGVFGEYLMTPSRSSVVVIDGKRRHVQCEWQDIQHGNVIVWVEPLHL